MCIRDRSHTPPKADPNYAIVASIPSHSEGIIVLGPRWSNRLLLPITPSCFSLDRSLTSAILFLNTSLFPITSSLILHFSRSGWPSFAYVLVLFCSWRWEYCLVSSRFHSSNVSIKSYSFFLYIISGGPTAYAASRISIAIPPYLSSHRLQ